MAHFRPFTVIFTVTNKVHNQCSLQGRGHGHDTNNLHGSLHACEFVNVTGHAIPRRAEYTCHARNVSYIFTGRNEVVAMVMFLLVSVILFTGGVCLSAYWDTTSPPPMSRHPPSRHPPPEQAPPRAGTPGIQSMSGRYASYWNAFLFSDAKVISDHNYITRYLNLKIYTYNTLAWSLSHLGQLHTSICVKLTLQKVPTQEMSEDSYICISYLPYINYDFVTGQCQ